VRRELRREVGFGCPAAGCGNPYLQYHHFDPPWEIEHHHDPARMIALCATHHGKAEAWTVEQCRAMKSVPNDRPEVRGKFEWMRDDILAVIGGGLYYETPNMVVYHDTPIVWFNRDEQRHLMLNLRLLTTSKKPRMRLEDNDWIISGEPVDVESPPKGNRLRVHYSNGDDVSVRFREWPDAHMLSVVYPRTLDLGSQLKFPLVTAEISFQVGGTNVKFGPTSTTLGHGSHVGLIASRCANGLVFR
jgi:hypothetical protein